MAIVMQGSDEKVLVRKIKPDAIFIYSSLHKLTGRHGQDILKIGQPLITTLNFLIL